MTDEEYADSMWASCPVSIGLAFRMFAAERARAEKTKAEREGLPWQEVHIRLKSTFYKALAGKFHDYLEPE